MKPHKLLCTAVKEAWVLEAQAHYLKKINYTLPLSIQTIKTISVARDQQQIKIKKETQLFLKHIDDKDFVILFSEEGEKFSSSQILCEELVRIWEFAQPTTYVVGGAYGIGEEVKSRAQKVWGLSPYTFNHHLAQVMVLEQLYRSTSLWHNLPYHN